MIFEKTNKMNGWIFIDKPQNLSSFQVIRRIRKVLNIKKIGHAGTLDPFATGLLAIAIGEATKCIKYFNKPKSYFFKVTFGESKDTDDITGKTMNQSDVIPSIKEIEKCLVKFIGSHSQVPPNYSAVKINGQRAYKLARKNKKFIINPRLVDIYSLECLETSIKNEFIFNLECSAGTYVRSIARDLGEMLGTFAHVSELRRTKIGKFGEKHIILLDKFEELVHIGGHFDAVRSISDVLDDIPAVVIDNDLGQKFQNGLGFEYFNKKLEQDFLLIQSKKKLLGIGKAEEGKIKPIRVFNL